MKLTRQTVTRGDLVLNMASMVDVVFLLLIFFMCTTSFQLPEERLPAPLPRKSAAGQPSPADDFEPIHIQVTGSGDIVTLSVNHAATDGFEGLFRRLSALRPLADVPVIISADDGINFKHCVRVLDLCIKARFTKVAFRA